MELLSHVTVQKARGLLRDGECGHFSAWLICRDSKAAQLLAVELRAGGYDALNQEAMVRVSGMSSRQAVTLAKLFLDGDESLTMPNGISGRK